VKNVSLRKINLSVSMSGLFRRSARPSLPPSRLLVETLKSFSSRANGPGFGLIPVLKCCSARSSHSYRPGQPSDLSGLARPTAQSGTSRRFLSPGRTLPLQACRNGGRRRATSEGGGWRRRWHGPAPSRPAAS